MQSTKKKPPQKSKAKKKEFTTHSEGRGVWVKTKQHTKRRENKKKPPEEWVRDEQRQRERKEGREAKNNTKNGTTPPPTPPPQHTTRTRTQKRPAPQLVFYRRLRPTTLPNKAQQSPHVSYALESNEALRSPSTHSTHRGGNKGKAHGCSIARRGEKTQMSLSLLFYPFSFSSHEHTHTYPLPQRGQYACLAIWREKRKKK